MGNKTIGKLISEGRKNKNISQEDLAKYIHVTRQTVSNWENDKNVPDISLIVKLCEYLNIDLNELISSKNNTTINTSNLIQVENNKIKRKILLPLSILVVIFIIAIIFLLIIINRNYFEVYDCELIGDGFSLNNCTLIKSKIQNQFNFGSLNSKQEYNDMKISLYYKDAKNKKIILEQEYEEDIKVSEEYGYSEYFYDNLEHIYLDLIYTDNGKKVIQTFQLQFKLNFKDNSLFYVKKERISQQNYNPVESVLLKKIPDESLTKNNYIYNSNTNSYKKDVKNTTYMYNKATNEFMLYEENKEEKINLIYYLDYNIIELNVISVNKNESISFVYHLNSEKIECTTDICNHNSIDILLKEIEKIADVK